MEDQNIPIDINSGKLLDWLINRRHCSTGWQVHVKTIREKINNALQDMPVHEEIARLLTGTYINYFHCKRIVEILKETEADSKNLFGRYGSQRMKDWQEIIRMYEKDNLYLAEVAQMLIRNITYEIPNLKKQIQKLEQSKNDLQKKAADYKKSETQARSEFQSMCKNLRIEGKNIKKELVDLIVELPQIYTEVVKKCQSLREAVEFYSAFIHFVLGRYHDGGCVPIVQYVIDKGNTTTYQWIYGEEPLSIVEPSVDIEIEDQSAIDLIDDQNAIDFNEEVDLDEGGEIDWGDINVVEENNEALDIDLNISLEESGIVVESAGHEGGVATGDEALTILDNPKIRNDFIDQLLELEAFFKLRLYELKSESKTNLLSLSQMQLASPILQLSTMDSTQNMLDNVQVVLSTILDSRVQHLHSIKHSPKYIDILTETLKQKREVIEKMGSIQKNIVAKKKDITEQIEAVHVTLKLVVQRTKELQFDIEQELSKKYNNRAVRLTGGINNM
ncbi:CDK5 regulatory subunit-associated protein 3 [Chelonus insularis]|uniref:CDK5 regulatory subunit-associated protein 3 n=1 Tax=Chelonus insularis TaxID=460826 RepID=UPI00158AC172|nr:CDK5 regulatory subunit-associated protein 3 [Chelonus insularis]